MRHKNRKRESFKILRITKGRELCKTMIANVLREFVVFSNGDEYLELKNF